MQQKSPNRTYGVVDRGFYSVYIEISCEVDASWLAIIRLTNIREQCSAVNPLSANGAESFTRAESSGEISSHAVDCHDAGIARSIRRTTPSFCSYVIDIGCLTWLCCSTFLRKTGDHLNLLTTVVLLWCNIFMYKL